MKKLFVRLTMALALVAGLSLAMPTAANATYNDPKVNVSGHLDCGGAREATWVWYEATNGERGWANTEDWTSVSRWAAPARMMWVKIKTYRVYLTNVSKDGTTLTIKVGCRGVLSGDTVEYKTWFGVNRPTFGRSATRHVCYNPPLGCWV